MYILTIRGFKPSYYSQEERNEGLQRYHIMRRIYSGVSFHKISYNKFLKDITTGRTL